MSKASITPPEPGTSSPLLLKEADSIRTARKATKSIKYAASGAYLPLCTDKIRNNVKSRILLGLLYACGAAVVAMIFLLSFYSAVQKEVAVSWSVTPPKTFVMGVPIREFAVAINDENNQGLANRRVSLTLTPVGKTPLAAMINDQPFVTREIDCASALVPLTRHVFTDLLFCAPNDDSLPRKPLLYNIDAFTDEKGVARFSNVTLALGIPGGQYVLQANDRGVGSQLDTPGYVVAFLELRDMPFELTVNDREAAPYNETTLQLPLREFWSFDVQAKFTLPAEADGGPPDGYEPEMLAAAFIPLDLERSLQATSLSKSIPYVATDMLSKYATVDNAVGMASAKHGDIVSLGNRTYVARIRFEEVMMLGVSSMYMYYGIAALGSVRVLTPAPQAINAPRQVPNSVYIPFLASSAVESVTVTSAGNDGGVIYDGFPESFVTNINAYTGPTYVFKVVVRNANGSPCQYCHVFLDATPSRNNGPRVGKLNTHPGYNPKKLIFNINVTNDDGVTYVSPIFSSTGAPGIYDLVLTCAGVTAQFVNTPSTVRVVPRPAQYDLVFIGEGGRVDIANLTSEEVGFGWNTLPAIQVKHTTDPKSKNPALPVPGKQVEIVAANPDLVGVIATASPTGDSGWSAFTAVQVPYAAYEGEHTFHVLIDGVVAATFNRTLNFNMMNDPAECSFVRMLSFPEITYYTMSTAQNHAVEVVAVNYKGESIATNVTVGVTYNEYEFTLGTEPIPAGSQALGYSPSDFLPTGPRVAPFVVGLTVSCTDGAVSSLALPIVSRVQDASANIKVYPTGLVDVEMALVANWSTINSSNPIVADVSTIMQSRYGVTSLGEPNSFRTSTMHVTDQQQSSFVLKQQYLVPFPSLMVLGVLLDNTLWGGALVLVETPLLPGATLTIVRTAIPRSYQWEPSVPFIVQPVVRFRGSRHEDVRIRAYAQLGLIEPTTNKTRWLDAAANYTDLQHGLLTTQGAVQRRFVTYSEAFVARSKFINVSTNHIEFEALALVAAIPGERLKIRYCLNPSFNASVGLPAICVEEPGVFTVPDSFGVEYQVAPASGVTVGDVVDSLGNPVQMILDPFTLSMKNPGSRPTSFFAACIQMASSGNLGAQDSAYVDGRPSWFPFNSFVSSESEFAIKIPDQTIGFRQNLPEGLNTLEFYAPGSAKAITLQVYASYSAESIAFVSTPPYANGLDLKIPLDVAVLNFQGRPLVDKNVQLAFASTDKSCQGLSCGKIASTSKTVAKVDQHDQVAPLSLVFDAAATGFYKVTASVPPPFSAVVLRQTFSQTLHSLSSQYGFPTEAVVAASQSLFSELKASRLSEILTNIVTVGNGVSEGRLANDEEATGKTAESYIYVKNQVQYVDMEVPPSDWDFTVIASQLAGSLNISQTYEKGVPPTLVVLDEYHLPVVGVTVDVQLIPNTGDFFLDYPRDLRTDQNGRVRFPSMTVTASKLGKFAFHFSVNGGGGNTSTTFKVTSNPVLTTKRMMEFAAYAIVIIFSPVLVALVPNSRIIYPVLAAICVTAVLAVAFWGGITLITKQGDFFLVYTVYSLLLVATVSVGCIGMAIVGLLGRVAGIYPLRRVNDEPKALNVFLYAKWMLNVRVDRQVVPEIPVGAVGKLINKVKAALGAKVEKVKSTVEANLELITIDNSDEAFADSHAAKKHAQRMRRRREERQPLYFPPGVNDLAVYPPINFIIVISLTLSLLIGLSLFVWYLHLQIDKHLGVWRSYFPNIPETAATARVNELIVNGLEMLFRTASAQFPQYFAPLNAISLRLRGVDLFSIFRYMSELLGSLQTRLTIAFAVGLAFAILAVLGTILRMFTSVPNLILKVRRGKEPEIAAASDYTNVETYIGLHVMLFILLFIMTFVVIFILTMILSVAMIRVEIYERVKVILIGSIGSIIISFIIGQVIVKRFLTEGHWVLRPEFYSLYHFVGLILGIFSGITKALSRWILSLLSMTFLFAKVDNSIFPPVLGKLDMPHTAFHAIVASEAHNGNPFMLLFASLLLQESTLRASAVAAAADGSPDAENETLEADKFGVAGVCDAPPIHSSGIANLCRVMLRFQYRPAHVEYREKQDENPKKWSIFKEDTDLPLNKPPVCDSIPLAKYHPRNGRQEHERVRNRWWLYVLLHHNPSLRALRKQRLFTDTMGKTVWRFKAPQKDDGEEQQEAVGTLSVPATAADERVESGRLN